jgi:phosphate transport system permease protein
MKPFYKRFFNKFIEGLLMMSSTITTLTVLLIIVFLFKEGAGIFKATPLEEGNVLVVNNSNPIHKISALQIKDIFDQKITNWKELGGKDEDIILFRLDDITTFYTEEDIGPNLEHLPALIQDYVSKTEGVIAFFPTKYLQSGKVERSIPMDKITVSKFLTGKEWFPTAHPAAQFGALSLILGTLWVSLGAILIALPLGLATAIYMAEIADERIRRLLKPVIELLAGIPSVVFGFFGLIVIVPLIQRVFHLPVGETGLAGAIVLGIMALPTIITISEDAMRTTPLAMKEASLALGANKWQTIYRVVVPYSLSGITAAAILGIGRAVGETMAVLMVTGNAAVIPHSFLTPVRTIPATIAAELGEAAQGGIHYKALFALGCILFIITMVINLTVEFISNRGKQKKISFKWIKSFHQ